MRIVVFGDLHLYRLVPGLRHLLSKRPLGMVNLWLNRRNRFDLSLLGPTVRRMEELAPDLLLGCGDLTTVATEAEFADARAALEPLLVRFASLLVPGNHDRYTFTAERRRRFEQFFAGHCPSHYPYFRDLGQGLALAALDPCRANWLSNRGDVRDQLEGLERWLGRLRPGQRLVVLCHYTLGAAGSPRSGHGEGAWHRMRGEGRLREMLAGCGVPVLYLHGHVHRPWCYRLAGGGDVVAVNAGAPLLCGGDGCRGQGFWEIGVGPGWHLVRHVMDGQGRWRRRPVEVPVEAGRWSDCRLVEAGGA